MKAWEIASLETYWETKIDEGEYDLEITLYYKDHKIGDEYTKKETGKFL